MFKVDTQLKADTPLTLDKAEPELSKAVSSKAVSFKAVSFKEEPLTPPPVQSTLPDKPTPPLVQFTPLDKPLTPLDKLTLLAEVESEERTFTDNHKLVDTSLEEVESDNDSLSVSSFITVLFINYFLWLMKNLNLLV
jgi:hypothetical protein